MAERALARTIAAEATAPTTIHPSSEFVGQGDPVSSLALDIATFLTTALPAESLVIGTNLFMGQAPDEPDAIVCVYERPGVTEFNMGAEDGVRHDPALEHTRFQIMVRTDTSATAYPTGSGLIYRIHRALSVTNVDLQSGTRYLSIEPMGMPGPLDPDKQDRLKFVANFQAIREPEDL